MKTRLEMAATASLWLGVAALGQRGWRAIGRWARIGVTLNALGLAGHIIVIGAAVHSAVTDTD